MVIMITPLTVLFAPNVNAQGSRKDDIVFGPSGHPVAGATVTVCLPSATGTPCSPLAALYTDATLSVPAANPFQTDGIGNYHFYAPAGRYQIQISGPGITGTITYRDVILPADVSSTGSGNNISAFGLTLGGNLTVAGNATINGTLTTSNFSPTTLTPASLNVAGNESIKGPLPYVDVTAYGADGTGAADSTTAIQSAITEACTSYLSPFGGVTADVVFPPGNYKVTQTQLPSTAPIFAGCPSLRFLGMGGEGGGAQFTSAPQARINVVAGSTPNNAAAISIVEGDAVQNLIINGYNQAVFDNAPETHLIDDCFTAQTTGSQDNAGLEIADTEFVWVTGGCTQTSSASVPGIEIVNDNVAAGTGDIYFSDMMLVGGGIDFIGRTTDAGGGVGNFKFTNDILEACGGPFFQVTAPGAPSLIVSALSFDHIAEADCGNYPVMSFNVSGGVLSGVHMDNVGGSGVAGSSCPLEMISGSLSFFFATGGPICVSNSSGAIIGDAVSENSAGFDYVLNTSNMSRLDSTVGANNGTPLRATSQGNTFASLALDPAQGLLFNDGANYGYDAGIFQPSLGNVDVEFVSAFAPTGIAGTAMTGGTLATGTYYYAIQACITPGCNETFGTQSQASAPVVVSGSNNAVNVTWTPPQPGQGTITGYLIKRGTSLAQLAPNAEATPNVAISGASTTSYTDTGFSGFHYGPLPAPPNYQSVHRFTSTSLGVNTPNPQYNLDVNGTAAVNSLNGIQKAERFSGSDAGVQLNACLTAASNTSGVCDGRGMTGTYTAAAHITIPKGTVLLWCQGKLTVDDATTKDAIELGGDGASLYGCQESGSGTVARPETSGIIACGITGCTTVENPTAASANIDWVHISGVYLGATGANSTVLNLTSVGHADIENNRLDLGTGGNSFGVYGNTSTGDKDSTNNLIKHNEIDTQTTGDTCLSLSGIFHATVLELNSCYMPPGAAVGFTFLKDTNGNYPDNDEFYGNDCEGASQAFGQVCYWIQGANSITIGPNNRCENVYNCFEFPSDGSAVGIHILDPYLSLSNHTQVLPNEPATAMVAVDNNGHNWLPSMHFGINDLAGPNLLGNAGFEGWQNATTLYYWGGATGTNINQAGSGIYLQNASSSTTPAVDSFTQGSYSVRVGDGATAGLGLNSGCIAVDSTSEYTMMFRVASASVSNNFRPGFRFYSDSNCTETNRITSVATNARVLSPASYAGTSNLAVSGANWQSTNASLTYNNGITCNCNVTGADWQVATASSWTPTRNFGIIFRVPNAYSNASTIAHSMRVFLLENTAAANNYVYFDDAILSQGPVSPNVRFAPLNDSANGGTVNGYGSYDFAGTLSLQSNTSNVGTFSHSITANRAWTLPDTSGAVIVQTGSTPANGDCAQFSASGGTISIADSGTACAPALYTSYAMGFLSAGQAPSGTNAVDLSTIYLPNVQFSHITVDVSTSDSNTGDFYSWAITDTSGNVKCSISVLNLTAGGASDASCTQGTVTLAPGKYIFAFTGNATTGKIAYSGTAPLALSSAVSSSTSSGGAITFPISIPAAGVTYSSYGLPAIILH
jgi:Pectate lyase superfamily protein